MKRIYLMGMLSLAATLSFAQEIIEPKLVPNMVSYQISPNGKWVRGNNGNSCIYNIAIGEAHECDLDLGSGNYISNHGSAVGSDDSGAAIYINGKTVTPSSMLKYWFCSFNAITPNDTRVVGTFNNTQPGTMYLPFYCDIAEDGTVGEPVTLPYPEKDLVGSPVQFVSALWINEDGDLILGEVLDDFGYYAYPIIFTQKENGEWDYSLPTEYLFNPNHIEMPANPWLNEPPFPTPTEYMSPNALAAYNKAMQDANEGKGEYPDPAEYMTSEEIAQYNEAADAYNKWEDSLQSEIRKYEQTYFQILADSYQFPLNEIVLSVDGKMFSSTSATINQDATEEEYYIYIHNLESGEGRFVDSAEFIQPHQILDDGTVIANYPINSLYSGLAPSSFVIEPESDKLLTISEYWQKTNPGFAMWIDENLTDGSGIVSMSNDKSIIIGSIKEENWAGNEIKFPDYLAYTYIFNNEHSGIESILPMDENGYKVFNLQGVNILNTKNAAAIKELPAGLYIINGKKYLVK